jgi:hypothetical protein
VILNDMRDYKDAKCVSVVYDAAKFAEFADPKLVIGHTLKVSGHVQTYKDRPQLVAERIEWND